MKNQFNSFFYIQFYGPRIGALYVKHLGSSYQAPIYPMLLGGGQERSFRPGTENTPVRIFIGYMSNLIMELKYLDDIWTWVRGGTCLSKSE